MKLQAGDRLLSKDGFREYQILKVNEKSVRLIETLHIAVNGTIKDVVYKAVTRKNAEFNLCVLSANMVKVS